MADYRDKELDGEKNVNIVVYNPFIKYIFKKLNTDTRVRALSSFSEEFYVIQKRRFESRLSSLKGHLVSSF